MKQQAIELIQNARSASELLNCMVSITFEHGRVVDVFLGENLKDKEMFAQLTNLLRPLTGTEFYGKLKLNYINKEMPVLKIEKSIKIG